MQIDNVESVEIDRRRWRVALTLHMQDGSTQGFVASADSGYTSGDGIWWGTDEDYAEAEAELW